MKIKDFQMSHMVFHNVHLLKSRGSIFFDLVDVVKMLNIFLIWDADNAFQFIVNYNMKEAQLPSGSIRAVNENVILLCMHLVAFTIYFRPLECHNDP